MIILIYIAIGFICSIIVAFLLWILLRYLNSIFFKPDVKTIKQEPDSELVGVIVESPKPEEVINTDDVFKKELELFDVIVEPSETTKIVKTDNVFNFQYLPPELRLMIYHRMELIPKLQLRSISSIVDRMFIDETCRNMKSMTLSSRYVIFFPNQKTNQEDSCVEYEKNGVQHLEFYNQKDMENLRNICCYYFREKSTETFSVCIDWSEIIYVKNDANETVFTFYGKRDFIETLKCIPYSSITSESRMDPEIFDLMRTRNATSIECEKECTISKEQLYGLKCKKIHLNIPSFDGLMLKEYIVDVLFSNVNEYLQSFRVRTTKINTEIFVEEMLKVESENHTNSAIFKDFIETGYFIDCFAGGDELCEAKFRLRSDSKEITVYVSESEIKTVLSDI